MLPSHPRAPIPARLRAPLRVCAGKGCTNRVKSGRCAECARAKEQERGTFRQRHGGLYDSRWSAYSVSFRQRYPLCGMRPNGEPPVMSKCHDAGRVTDATGSKGQVDHVIPVWQRPDMFRDESNHQTLCRACGAAKSQAGL